MSTTEKRKIKVFIASPNDLAEERRVFRNAIDVLNIGFGDGKDVEFVPLGWEDTLASTGRRSQSVINADIDSCDVFILAMHRRWGQEAPDAAPYSSYTEEEFHRALERWKKTCTPEIFVFFKRVDAASEADPGVQLSKVIKFRQHLEETRQILYHYFDSPESFLDEVDRHLRAYAKDELPKAKERDDTVVLPIAALEEVKKAKQIAEQKTEEARQAKKAADEARLKIEEAQLEMAEDAAKLAMEGKIEFAREKFTKLVTETTNLRILYLGYEFFYRTGDLDSVEIVLEKWLSLSGAENMSVGTADAMRFLGNVYFTRGELERTEEIYQKSLAIYEVLGRKEGMAKIYGNLGGLYSARGEVDRAEEMYQSSLSIHESLGLKDCMAKSYGNLGNLYFMRGDFKQAEEMCQTSFSIDEAQECWKGMANDYCGLGIVYRSRGEFQQALEMFQKAFSIHEALGDKEGMARNYGNLGIVYQSQDDLERAEKMHTKSLEFNKVLGRKEGMARNYSNLGNVYLRRGDIERAEEMYQKALDIDIVLCRKEGMASVYCNLGTICKIRYESERAEEMYQKAIILFRAIGSPKAKEVVEWLQELNGGRSPSSDSVEA